MWYLLQQFLPMQPEIGNKHIFQDGLSIYNKQGSIWFENIV